MTVGPVINMNGGGMGVGVGSSSIDTYFPCEDASAYPKYNTKAICQEWRVKDPTPEQ